MSVKQQARSVVRGVLKRLLRPLITRVYARVDAHIEAQLEAVRRQLNDTVGDLSALRRDIDRTVSTVLNALSNQNASARMKARALEAEHARLADELTRQIELARKEIALDARYDPNLAVPSDVGETDVSRT